MNGAYGPEEFNFTTIPKEIRERATQECNRLGCTMPLIVRGSNHPEDNRKYIVMGRQKEGRKAYNVWTAYSSTRGMAFEAGYYDLDFPSALNIVMNKLTYHQV